MPAGNVNVYTAAAPTTAGESTVTPATVAVGNVFKLEFFANDGDAKSTVEYTAAAATVADVVAGIVAQFNLQVVSDARLQRFLVEDVGGTHVRVTAPHSRPADPDRELGIGRRLADVHDGGHHRLVVAVRHRARGQLGARLAARPR